MELETSEAGDGGTTPLQQAIRERAQRFAALRGVQRALARAVHPAELEEANRRGKELLILLQDLHRRVTQGNGWGPIDPEELKRVDQLLDSVTTRTRSVLANLEIAQLRAVVPQFSEENASEAQSLLDLLLDGDLEDNKNLRSLEFLITMLSSAEHGGHRVPAREPGDLTPRLHEITGGWIASRRVDDLEAARTFEAATAMLDTVDDLGAVRDRIRRYKEHLGAGILHPRVLHAAVEYNVAMWNHVAALIEGGAAIDTLTVALLGGEPENELTRPAASASRTPSRPVWLFESEGFCRLVAALRARVVGKAIDDEPAETFAAACTLDGLRPFEIQSFEAEEEEEPARLVTTAVVLGFISRHADDLRAAFVELGLESEILLGPAAEELAQAMTGHARKLFADSAYDEAFLLSEVKTRHIGSFVTERDELREDLELTDRRAAPPAERRFGPDFGLPPGIAVGALLLLVLPALAALVVSLSPRSPSQTNILGPDEIEELSPFLTSAYQRTLGEHTEFVGRLNRGWNYLPSHQRMRVLAEMTADLRGRGVHSVTLKDQWERVHARYRPGKGLVLEDVARIGERVSQDAPAPPAPAAP